MLLFILWCLCCLVWCPVWGTFEGFGCPEQELIAPSCMCKNLGDGPMMLCNNIMSAEELIRPIKVTDSFKMFSLGIIDSSLLYIPNDIFVNTKYERIRFANSQIMSLSDTDVAFKGLEDRLEEIRATDAQYITTWDWSQLRNLRRIKLIDIHMISMYRLEEKFPPLKSLISLGISKAEISFIHPQAFADLDNLINLVLENNEISEMKREMLPNPAEMLHSINLNNNLLKSFPDNMFINMPNLEELYLENNKFVTLNEDTFRWPLEHLRILNFKGSDFHCDCRLRWIVKTEKPFSFQANCTLPANLAGVTLNHLSEKVLWC